MTDTERLDWLNRYHWDLVWSKAFGGLWAVGDRNTDLEISAAPDVRGAIDRAMEWADDRSQRKPNKPRKTPLQSPPTLTEDAEGAQAQK